MVNALESLLIGTIMLIGVVTVGGGHILYSLINRDNMLKKVSEIADTNNDNATTEQEYIAVYKEVGARYDALNPGANGLSNSQLRQYIKNHTK